MTVGNEQTGAFAPLKSRVFLVLWIATILGNVGSFVRDVASAWLITDLSPDPAAVTILQAAATLPVFLLAIPAGVLSDIMDRRRFLIVIQLVLLAASLCLLVLSANGLQSSASLIGLTFVGGIGAALMAPTWQAIVPELVSKTDLKGAVALNGLGINIARAIGPAIGGILLAYYGASFTYGVDVISYLFVISALFWWKSAARADDPLAEHFGGAFRAGLRYAKASKELHVVLLRAAVFFLFASNIWALLPLLAKNVLGGSAGFYGVLLGAVGLGAIGGALLMPRVRQRLNADSLMLIASLLTAAGMIVLSLGPPQWAAVCVMLVLGAAWIVTLTTLNGAAQTILPNWVRGRALAVYLTVFNGAMTFGSLVWGGVAHIAGIQMAMVSGAIGLTVTAILFRSIKLPKGEADLTTSAHWPEPLISDEVDNDRGPVLILIEYRINAENRTAFRSQIYKLSTQRRRDGAYSWGLTEDANDPTRMIEWFFVESWAEHLRQHRRVSNADVDIQASVRRFHVGDGEPVVQHLLGVPPAAVAPKLHLP
jgi:MFS family permease